MTVHAHVINELITGWIFLILPVTFTSVNAMKYKVGMHNISQYLQMAQNKVMIL